MTHEESEAQELLDSRLAVYGDRIDNMERVALIWSGLLGHEVHAWQIPLLMSSYKMFRAFQAPDYSDNIDDVDGWNLMFREVIGEDLIQARTVEEFLEQKKFRAMRHHPAGKNLGDQTDGKNIEDWIIEQTKKQGGQLDESI